MLLSETVAFLAPAIVKDNKHLPILNHVRLTEGYAIAYDGILAMCCPVAIPVEACPNGEQFKAAAFSVGDEFQCVQEVNGNITLRGGKVRVTVQCSVEPYPMPDFHGTPLVALGEHGTVFVETLKKLLPFVVENESRPWMNTILFRGNRAVATCGHALAWCEVPWSTPQDVMVPAAIAKALIKLNTAPEYILGSASRFTVAYSGARYVSAPQVTTPWPNVDALLELPAPTRPTPPDFFAAIRTLMPFLGSMATARIYFKEGRIHSRGDKGIADIAVDGLPIEGKSMNVLAAKLMEAHATHLDFDGKVVGWSGNGMRGCIMLGALDG